MRHICALLLVITTVFISGCTNLPPAAHDNHLDERLKTALDNFCPIPDDAPESHSIRAHMALAAIAGYSYRSIQNYSKPNEAADDATRAIARINTAYKTLTDTDAKLSSGMYPIQRVDTIIDLTEAAEAAISPTVRAGKTFITGSITDRVSLMKTAMIAFLEDKLYLDGYNKACTKFSALKKNEIDGRIKERCGLLEIVAKSPSTCKIP